MSLKIVSREPSGGSGADAENYCGLDRSRAAPRVKIRLMNEVTEEAYSVMLLEELIEKLSFCWAAPLGFSSGSHANGVT